MIAAVARPVADQRVRAERDIDGDDTLRWIDLSDDTVARDFVKGIARALAADNRLVQLITIGRLRNTRVLRSDEEDALSAVVSTLRTAAALRVYLDGDSCEQLRDDLADVALDYEACESCRERPGHINGYCADCAELLGVG